MIVNSEGVAVETDDAGYLVDPSAWDARVARQLAADEQVALSNAHWRVLNFMRDYYEDHQVIADARFAIRFLSDELGYGRKARNELFTLFPYGYVKQACRIAGMKRPRAWSTG